VCCRLRYSSPRDNVAASISTSTATAATAAAATTTTAVDASEATTAVTTRYIARVYLF